MSEYRGTLTKEERDAIDNELGHDSVRGIARQLDLPYGKVRRYVEGLDETTVKLADNHFSVLVFDVETAPLLAHVWHPFGDYVGIDQLLHSSFMLTWSAKWYGDDHMMNDRLTGDEALAQDDTRIIESLAELVREADVVIAHNGDRFDIPVLNKRLFLLGLEPLPPITSIDTLKLAKKNFKLARNNLDHIARELGLGGKIKTDFDLWKNAYQGDEDALKEMQTYNDYDVVILEKVFDRMKPYVRRLKRMVDGPGFTCPFCGSEDLSKAEKPSGEDKPYRTQVSTYQMWQCQNCRKFSRSKTLKEKRHPLHPL